MNSLHPGGSVVHSEGRLIPHEFPITDLKQITGLNGIGRITCTVSSGTPRFNSSSGSLQTGGASLVGNRAVLLVNTTDIDTFQNRDMYCDDRETNHFYLYLTASNNSELFTNTKVELKTN